MTQLVAGSPISDSFVDYSTLHEYFTIRVGVFWNFTYTTVKVAETVCKAFYALENHFAP